MRRVSVLACYLFLFSISCIDPYTIPEVLYGDDLLVVGGFINSNGPTTIQLSHSVALDSKKNPVPELKAQVRIADDNNNSYLLTETGGGFYSIGNITIDPNRKYRIQIKKSDQREYASDFVDVRQTPLIDSISWKIDEARGGIQIYVNTHDPLNLSRYYTWEFSETWQYRADFATDWEYINGQVVYNPYREPISNCWHSKKSSALYLTSTEKLVDDVVYQFPIVFYPANSSKFEIGYRISVTQYALTHDAYDYLYNLKRNTEQQGSIFDAQPTHLLGNIHCITNGDEKVLGYIGVQGATEKSTFILGRDLPNWFNGRTTHDCSEDVTIDPLDLPRLLSQGDVMPANNSEDPSTPIYQPTLCVDCRVQGGTNVKPDFWPKWL